VKIVMNIGCGSDELVGRAYLPDNHATGQAGVGHADVPDLPQKIGFRRQPFMSW